MQSPAYLQHSKGMVTTAKAIRKIQPVTEYQPLTRSSKSKRTKSSSLVTEDQNLAVQHKEVQHSTVISRFRLQVRFINQAWNTELLRTRSGWTFNICMRNVISWDSSTFIAVSTGNVSMLQELCQKGQASLLDIFEDSEYTSRPSYLTLLAACGTDTTPIRLKTVNAGSVCQSTQPYIIIALDFRLFLPTSPPSSTVSTAIHPQLRAFHPQMYATSINVLYFNTVNPLSPIIPLFTFVLFFKFFLLAHPNRLDSHPCTIVFCIDIIN